MKGETAYAVFEWHTGLPKFELVGIFADARDIEQAISEHSGVPGPEFEKRSLNKDVFVWEYKTHRYRVERGQIK